MSQVCDTAHSGDNDAEDLLLIQKCAELESQDDDTALVVTHVAEMMTLTLQPKHQKRTIAKYECWAIRKLNQPPLESTADQFESKSDRCTCHGILI